MGKPISLFSDYHSFENTVTNYCGLMMKLIYRESPQLLNRLFEILFKGKMPVMPVVGPVFMQQIKKSSSVPDLEIRQTSFQILFETKIPDWFHEDQIRRHVAGFDPKIDLKVLILLTDEHRNSTGRRTIIQDLYSNNGVFVIELTFEDIVRAFSEVCLADSLKEYLSEFREFLDRHYLLPRWEFRLDVVNCGATRHEVLNDLVYMCPDAGGQYNHQRSKYFGAYWDKAVNHIFLIDAVVSFDVNFATSQIKWNNSNVAEKVLIQRAKTAIKKYRSQEIARNAIQVFLLSDKRDVSFRKDTRGGLFGSKRYFMINGAIDIDRCVDLVDGKCWSYIENQQTI